MDEAKRLVELIPRLRRYARALVGDRATADDLVQDARARLGETPPLSTRHRPTRMALYGDA